MKYRPLAILCLSFIYCLLSAEEEIPQEAPQTLQTQQIPQGGLSRDEVMFETLPEPFPGAREQMREAMRQGRTVIRVPLRKGEAPKGLRLKPPELPQYIKEAHERRIMENGAKELKGRSRAVITPSPQRPHITRGFFGAVARTRPYTEEERRNGPPQTLGMPRDIIPPPVPEGAPNPKPVAMQTMRKGGQSYQLHQGLSFGAKNRWFNQRQERAQTVKSEGAQILQIASGETEGVDWHPFQSEFIAVDYPGHRHRVSVELGSGYGCFTITEYDEAGEVIGRHYTKEQYAQYGVMMRYNWAMSQWTRFITVSCVNTGADEPATFRDISLHVLR